MYKLKIYGNLYKGEKRSKGSFGAENEVIADLLTEEKDGVVLVSADVISENALDPTFGVGIDIELNVKRYMADYKMSPFWCKPFFGTDLTEVPDETQALAYEKPDGTFGVILPVVNDAYKCVLVGKDKTTVTARLYSNYPKMTKCKGIAFVCAEGEKITELMERCTKVALRELGFGIPHRTERRYPEMFDYLGWCSWDSMQIRVNHEGLLEKCREFRDKEIPVRWAILDDMWAEVRDFKNHSYDSFMEMCLLMHAGSLYDFEADPERFPKGLKACVEDMKEFGLKIGMWHPTTGYWRGIDPDGAAYQKLKDYLMETDDGIFVPDWKREKAYGFYHTIHDFFKRCGVDFVKIDNQSMSDRFYNGLAPIGTVAKEFHEGMEASVGSAFDNHMINCMGMSSEDMWSRPVSAISRCSDDFQPENREWFIKHVLQCSYNSLVQGQFHWCDWDMWWTDDGQAKKNSVVRAISGGPVYVSDKLGRSNKEILDPLVLNDGKVLRCDRPAVPTQDCICIDPTASGKGFKLQNLCGNCGVMTVFDLDSKNGKVTAEISPADIDGLTGEEFAVYEHFSKELVILKKEEKLSVTLENQDEFKLFLFVPYVDGFAAIGRTDKFISPKTIDYVCDKKVVLKEEGPYAYVENGKIYFN